MIPAHQLASRPHVFGQTLTRPSRSDPGRFCAIWSMLSLEKQNWIRCGKWDLAYTIWANSGCMLAAMAVTGRNQNASGLHLACLLGSFLHACITCSLTTTKHAPTLQASLSGTFLQTLPGLVPPLKGHSLSPCSCPSTLSAPSRMFGY